MYSEILSLDNVDRVGTRAVSKQEALEEEKKKNPEHFALVEDGDNPYRDSVVITYIDAAGVEALEIRLHEIEEVDDVVSRIEVANTVESLKSVLFFVSVGFFVTLLVVTVFIIITTIRVTLFSRQKEIEMMDALGATRSFIVLPFIIEGFVLGVVAAMLAFFAQGWIYGLIDNLATKN
ncbi:MAG: permease-like cell division protein FtsX, partial [Clostridia bacterium]|nr:permease-like cell division protein FtsX [Clostridia bacterium]